MVDVNLNSSECVKTITSFTEQTFYNICTGVTQTIGLGNMDLALNVLILLAAVLLLGAVLIIVKEALT